MTRFINALDLSDKPNTASALKAIAQQLKDENYVQRIVDAYDHREGDTVVVVSTEFALQLAALLEDISSILLNEQ